MENKIIIAQDAKTREQAYVIRRKVFVEEQLVPEELEIDEHDKSGNSCYVLLIESVGNAVATARFRPYQPGILKIERVAVLAEFRKTGAGRKIMEAIEVKAKEAGYEWLKLSAQLQAQGFYEKLGFKSQGEVYLDAQIEHIDMFKQL